MAAMNNNTVRVLRIIMPLVAVISLIVFVPWSLAKAWLSPLPDTVPEQLAEGVGYGLDGIIVYVDQAGNPPEQYAAGWHSKERKVAAYPEALFKIASIGKLYVAVAVTKLVHAKHIALDETLAHYYPELIGRIENADGITIRNMLQHRSGIPNFTDHPDYPWASPPKDSMEALSYALDLPADFKPGSDYSYSNTNYLLLAGIIDKVTGRSHHHYINEHILQPLGLSHTFSTMHEVDTANIMSGYFVGWEPDIKQNFHHSMIATAEDVGVFLRALNDGALLTKEEQTLYSSVYEYEHTGLVPGYQSIARYHKDIDAVIIQFTSTSGGDMWTLSEIVYNKVVKIVKKKAHR